MPDPTHTYGADTDPLGNAGQSGKLEKFDLKGVASTTSRDSAVHVDASGEYVNATDVSFNTREEIQVEYEANETGAVGGGAIAVIVGAYAVTAIAIRTTSTGHARVTITAHQHTGGTSANHIANARTITLPTFNGFGAADFMTSGLTSTDLQSGDWSASINHVDRQNNVGNFLCGAATGVKIDASARAVADSIPTSNPSGWILDRWAWSKSGDDFYAGDMAGHQYLDAEA